MNKYRGMIECIETDRKQKNSAQNDWGIILKEEVDSCYYNL